MEGKFKFFKGLVIELALFIDKAMARVLDNICKEIIKISVKFKGNGALTFPQE